MIPVIFELLNTALGLWESKERRKYIDELIELKRDYYEEYNKERPDHAILDNIEHRLRSLCKSFGSEAGVTASANK